MYIMSFFSKLTIRFLKTVAPLVVGQLSVFEGVAGVEQRPHAQLVFVEVNGAELRLVEQKVVVHVQLVEHPPQRIFTDGQNAGVKT